MRHAPLFLALPFTLIAGASWSAPATPEGAAALTATFQTYLGAVPGVVSVQPEGEVYGVKLDFAPLLVKLSSEGIEATITPLEFKLTDNGDGTWGMTEDQSISASVKAAGHGEFSLYIAHMASSGTFDPALGIFTTSTGTASDISVTETIIDPNAGPVTITYQVGALQSDSTGVANAVAGADVTATTQLSDLSESFQIPGMAPDAPPSTITMRAKTYDLTADMTGLRAPIFSPLLAFVVANPTPEAMDAAWPQLKTLLGDAIPVFDHLKSSGKMADIAVDSPLGQFGLTEAGVEIEANGLVADGMLREAFTLNGLTLPEGLVPAWAADLVPQTLTLDMKVAGFDAAAGAKKALDMVDASRQGGMVAVPENKFLTALLPKGSVDLTLAPGATTAPAYKLTYEGTMTAGMAAMPEGRATIGLTGLDAIREAVKSAPEDWGMQAAPVLAMAEGLAKKGDDGALIWELQTTPTGGVLVNGVDVAAMAGGQ